MTKPICWKRFDVRFSVGEIDSLIEQLNEQFQYADNAGQPISRETLRAYDKLVWRRQYETRRKGDRYGNHY